MAAPTLLQLFDGLICDEFKFRKQGIGADYCISMPHILYVPAGAANIPNFDPGSGGMSRIITPTTPKLALHLNFKCKVGGSLNLAITAFHITARPATGQQTIDEHGPSIFTAKESIHINRNTDWGREENLVELLRVLNGPSRADLLHVLNFHYSQGSVPRYVNEWKEKIKIKAQQSTRIMNITFHNSDKTFPSD